MTNKNFFFRTLTLLPSIFICLNEQNMERIILSIAFALIIWGIQYLLENTCKYSFLLCAGLVLVAGLFFPKLYFLLPALFYNLNENFESKILYLFIPLIFGLIIKENIINILLVSSYSLALTSLGTRFKENSIFIEALYKNIDQLETSNESYKQQQNELIELEDQKIELSTQREKQIIIAEIHDILGHQLSSAIIQLAALEYTLIDDDAKNSIKEVREQVSEAMNNVRKAIHSKRDNAVNLENEILALIRDNKSNAKINFNFAIKNEMNQHTKHVVINIVREALSNIYKHSNASIVKLSLTEINKTWNLLIYDNGNIKTKHYEPGIGLINMEERVNSLGGKFHVNANNGFRIFITLPHENNLA